MAKHFRWMPDPFNYEIKINGENPTEIVDGYSRWVMVHGADFDLTEEVSREHPDDFQYAMVVSNLLDGGTPAPGPIRSDDFQFIRFDFGQSGPTTSDPDKIDRNKLISRLPLRHRSMVLPRQELTCREYVRPEGVVKEELVLVGVIDDAINITHERFRTADNKSRVDFAWIQDADRMQDPSIPFGREWTNPEINAKLSEFGHLGEDVLLRALDVFSHAGDPYRASPIRLRTSHGTHVMDLAAGYDSSQPEAVNRRFITVQLPALSTQDTSGAGLIAAIRNAAIYIFNRAKIVSDELQMPVPVVLNLSYGFNGGPRTGLHVIERTLRKLAYDYRKNTACYLHGNNAGPEMGAPVELVVPAGNAHLTRGHATAQFDDNTNQIEFGLRLQPIDLTSSFVELWFAEAVHKINLVVTTPDGTVCPFVWTDTNDDPQESPDRILVMAEDDDEDAPLQTLVARVSVDTPNDVPRGLAEDGLPFRRVLLSIAPTSRRGVKRLPAPHGLWKLSISAVADQSHTVNAWIQRDIAVSGFGIRGRQAYFEERQYEETRFDRFGDVAVHDCREPGALVERNNTISGIATNVPGQLGTDADKLIKSIAVGGHRWDTTGAAFYSSAGPAPMTRDDPLTVPAFTAITESSRALPGVLSAGSRSGSSVVQNGTSVAAPQVVRHLSDMLADIEPDQRHTFKGVEHLASIAHPPWRPDCPHDERANNQFIRPERVDRGLLEPTKQVPRNISRGVSRKIHSRMKRL